MDEGEIIIRNDVLGTERRVTGTSEDALDNYAGRLKLLWECQAQRQTLLSDVKKAHDPLDFTDLKQQFHYTQPPNEPEELKCPNEPAPPSFPAQPKEPDPLTFPAQPQVAAYSPRLAVQQGSPTD
jgi:hypothetical protein